MHEINCLYAVFLFQKKTYSAPKSMQIFVKWSKTTQILSGFISLVSEIYSKFERKIHYIPNMKCFRKQFIYKIKTYLLKRKKEKKNIEICIKSYMFSVNSCCSLIYNEAHISFYICTTVVFSSSSSSFLALTKSFPDCRKLKWKYIKAFFTLTKI